MPCPWASIRPYMYCASGTPSAARRSQCTACCASGSTPTPLSRQSPRLNAATRSPEAAACSNQCATQKYIGNNVFNRISVKLKKKRVANSPDMWIRAVGAFPAIIEPELLDAAQTALAIRNRHLSNDEMLALLKELYLRRGRLTLIIIDEFRDLPTSATYRRHFGSLGRAYQLVGYLPYRARAGDLPLRHA
jgi:hypothetical protein